MQALAAWTGPAVTAEENVRAALDRRLGRFPAAGLDAVAGLDGVAVYAAGVGSDPSGRLVTAGGRVLDVCGHGATIAEARQRAYDALGRISWPGMQFRTDIAGAASLPS